ncbi:HAD family hydrolase [Streptomyces microflavus]|uniref:HAD family hydrolase n=1 Tax=Streptomyces microflavus TaxID=1919 RepID=UPI0037F6E747
MCRAVAAFEAGRASGRKVATVSNNSAVCVQTFLLLHGLLYSMDAVVGRAPYQPEAMKPSPDSLLRASSELAVPLRDCTLIGDSVTDVEAAKVTDGRSVGFANKAGKERALATAGADVVVTTMLAVADALRLPWEQACRGRFGVVPSSDRQPVAFVADISAGVHRPDRRRQ